VNTDFDVAVVGSGPAGVSAAFPLVEAGLKVLMVDGGRSPTVQLPMTDYLSARSQDPSQWKWMVGEDFHALKMGGTVSPKLRAPTHRYVFEGFNRVNRIIGDSFVTIGSLATGGLSNAWGCGIACYSESELVDFPFPATELHQSCRIVAKRIGISGGTDDDLSDYFGLDEWSQPPIPLDVLHSYVLDRYTRGRRQITSLGFRLGRSRVAVLSQDHADRHACNLTGNCLWGCWRKALYSSADELSYLRRFGNFSEISGFAVDALVRSEDKWVVVSTGSATEQRTFTTRRVVLAAGALATTRLALQALSHVRPVRVLACPSAWFLIWLPRFLGIERVSGFGLGQLSFALSLSDRVTAFGSSFSTIGISHSEFVRYLPLRRRYGIGLLRGLLSSCVVGNLFLPGHLTNAEARMEGDGSLVVSGNFADSVTPLMAEAEQKLRKAYLRCGGILLPGSFTVGRPGGDIHYTGMLPMKASPSIGETNSLGEVHGLPDVYIADAACLPTLSEKSHTLVIMANADRIGRAITVGKREC